MNTITRHNWSQRLDSSQQDALGRTWIAVGVPGYVGPKKRQRRAAMDERFGADGWRIGHYVRGRIVSEQAALREYEQSYRVFLHGQPALVDFLVSTCGNVYDTQPDNVHDHEYHQPHTRANHYQDIAVRRVIAELVDDPTWPNVTETAEEEVELTDLSSGKLRRLPRARGFRGDHVLQIRGVESPGYCLSPAVVPVHDPALVAMHPLMTREWWLGEGCQHLSVEAFWQTSKVLEVRYDRWLTLGEERRAVLAEINGRE